ncbi:MAG: class I SAM-dependent methyltransferase [Proteobacteria bacterium]|nr:class I SAM-dependent methyltransferase [Pseudomonadota bacterium]
MMRPDVVDLNQFYATSLGQTARRLIRRQIRALWPSTVGMRVLGLGYATPFLRQFRDEAERVIAMMPSSQGVSPWPSAEPSLVGLCDEAEIPLPDSSIDRVLMVHALETSEQVRPMLREVWRVLASGGRLMVVVPNRRGIWARVESTPFGTGSPFSPPQLERLMRDAMFSPAATLSALYFPPTHRRSLIRLAPAFEKIGGRWAQAVSGVLISEAGKQIFAVTAQSARRARRIRRPQVAFPRSAAPRLVVAGEPLLTEPSTLIEPNETN